MTEKKPSKAKAKGAEKKSASKAKKKDNKAVGDNVSSSDVFVLPAQVDIASVTQVYGEIKAMYVCSNITFDARAVDRITTPGIQLLFAAAGTAEKRGGTILVLKPSEAFRNIISDLGFSNQLKEWMGDNG